MTQREAFDTLDRIRHELAAGRFALAYAARHWDDPKLRISARAEKVTITQLHRCSFNLEMTFVLRLFSQFEAILRDYWQNGMRRRSVPEMRRLMDSVARNLRMNEDDLGLAHHVRDYRNHLIHQGAPGAPFDFIQCSRALGRYLRWTPRQW